MKEIVLEIIKFIVFLIAIFIIVNYVTPDNTKDITDKLGRIESNTKQIDSILNVVDSIKEQKVQIINNIDKRTIVVNQQKVELNKVLVKDTNLIRSIIFLHEFAK